MKKETGAPESAPEPKHHKDTFFSDKYFGLVILIYIVLNLLTLAL
jgi:hypothetical protein